MVPKLGGSASDADPSGQGQAVAAQAVPTVEAPAGAYGTPATAAAHQATVKKDAIAETMSVDGLVTAQQEVPIIYPGSGKVQDVKVKVGQAVNEGDVLLELDAVEISRSLDVAKARSQTSKANLAQARAQIVAQQQTAAQRAAVAAQQQQQAVGDAQAGLRKAQAQLTTVLAGASTADKHAAQNALINAQTVLQKAQTAQDKLQAGPDPAAFRQAKADVASAQLAVNKAKADLDTLLRGADPVALSQAQRDVDRLSTQLQLAQMAKLDPKVDPASAKLAHDSAIADAQLAVAVADDKLSKLKEPPADVDVQAARQRLQNAQDGLTAVTDRYTSMQQPADETTLDSAQTAIDVAQQAVDDAQARSDALDARPSPLEMADAQDGVRRAQAALDAARTPVQTNTDPGGVDLSSLQEAVNQDDADVASLGKQLEDTRVLAPFKGFVLRVGAKPGDSITSARPVFVLAQPGAPIVRVQLSDDEAARMAPGLKGNIVLDSSSSSSSPQIPATLVKLTTAAQVNGGTPTADLRVDWPSTGAPQFGLPVQVSLTLQEKPSVLVVPKKALRKTGARTYVEVLDGTLRRIANVEVGITSDDAVEIMSGLTEGQVVLLGS